MIRRRQNPDCKSDAVFDGRRRPALHQPPQGFETWTFDFAFEEVLKVDARRCVRDGVKIALTSDVASSARDRNKPAECPRAQESRPDNEPVRSGVGVW